MVEYLISLRQWTEGRDPEPVVAEIGESDGEDEGNASQANASAEGEQGCLSSARYHHPFEPSRNKGEIMSRQSPCQLAGNRGV